MPRPKFLLDCRRDKVYTSREWEEIILLHVAAHPGVKLEDCAGCLDLQNRKEEQCQKNEK